ncbi:MAG: ATP-dependent sacrificial sulfur transferase LarE [Elusimicrobiota bacterium]
MNTKFKALQLKLLQMKRVLIAFSGGVDSTFLLHAAVKTLGRKNVLAVTAVSETYPKSELKLAKKMLKRTGARGIFIRTSELKNSRFASNPRERCFYCKDELFKKLSALAKKNKMILLDATNYSDRTDFRPGRKAAMKWGVKSPIAEAKLTKDEIRKLSRRFKLPTWDLPAQACLASRIPYGVKISTALLAKIEKGEAFIKKLGFTNVRIRSHGNIARIEIDKKQFNKLLDGNIRSKIYACLNKLGWSYVSADILGYRTGSLNN